VEWLDRTIPASEELRYLLKDSLPVTRVYPPPGEPSGQAAFAL
jgi:hypothetical protein